MVSNYPSSSLLITAHNPSPLSPSVVRMGGIPAVNGKGERLLLYIGIIDILQSYR